MNTVRYLSALFNDLATEVVQDVIEILRDNPTARIAPRVEGGKPVIYMAGQVSDGLGTCLAHTWLEDYAVSHDGFPERVEAWHAIRGAWPHIKNYIIQPPVTF